VEENISHMIAYNAKIVVTGQNLKKMASILSSVDKNCLEPFLQLKMSVEKIFLTSLPVMLK